MVVKIAFGRIVPTGSIPLFLSLFVFLASLALANFLMRSARFSLSARIQNRLDVIAENGVFSRVLNLPVSFFSEYSAGE
jgi:ABC-type bacteriocin/lantibiotic exporter with double-glycine peptidase domain